MVAAKQIRALPRILLGCALAITCLVSSQASAQTLGQSRGELETPATQERPTTQIRTEFRRGSGEQATCPFEGNGSTVWLERVVFRPARDASQPLDYQFARLLTKEVEQPNGTYPLTKICEIRDQANAALRSAGWIAAVQVPPQDIVGTLVLEVVSASLKEIDIQGNTGPYEYLLRDIIKSLTALDPVNERDIERVLLVANDIPGLRVQMSLARAPEGGGALLGKLNASFERATAFANTRNVNAELIGRETVFGRVEYNGLTGLSDVTHIAAQTTLDFQEQLIFEAGHEFGVGPENVRVATGIVYAKSRPDIQNLDVEAETVFANLAVSYPVLRSPLASADLSAGFEYVDQETLIGSVTLSKDSIRTVYARAEAAGQVRRPDRSTQFIYSGYVELRKGLNILGGTQANSIGIATTDGFTSSRPFGEADAFIMRGGIDMTWFPNEVIDARVRMEAQWTDQPLLSFDEYAIGNLSIGRGYDPGANSGDRAIGGAYELGATVLKQSQHRLQLFGFFDIVEIENLDPATANAKRTLKSAGGGLRYNLGSGFSAELVYASPQDRALNTDQRRPTDRVLFSITTKFPALVR